MGFCSLYGNGFYSGCLKTWSKDDLKYRADSIFRISLLRRFNYVLDVLVKIELSKQCLYFDPIAHRFSSTLFNFLTALSVVPISEFGFGLAIVNRNI